MLFKYFNQLALHAHANIITLNNFVLLSEDATNDANELHINVETRREQNFGQQKSLLKSDIIRHISAWGNQIEMTFLKKKKKTKDQVL